MPSSNAFDGAAADSAALPEHCYYCFQVILAELNGDPEPSDLPFPDEGQSYPLFVTWNIFPAASSSTASRASRLLLGSSAPSPSASSSPSPFTGTPRLRGCIGTFEAYPLASGLAEYASISAFKDRRFHPIAANEVARLECGVSLLTAFEDCQDYQDWDVGTHGIYIHLPNPALAPKPSEDSASSSSSGSSTPAHQNRKPSSSSASSAQQRKASSSTPAANMLTATYLPDVIPDQGWTKVEAIDSAIRKAGWNGKITEAIRLSLRVRRYRSEKVARNYDDFVRWQGQIGAEFE